MVAARLSGVDGALRAILGDARRVRPRWSRRPPLARTATEACTLEGRPLYAAHAALDWPDEPHLALWQAITLLREFRGDGHIACLVEQEISGCEALVVHGATGEVPRGVLQVDPGPHRRGVGRGGRLAASSAGGSTPTGALTEAGRAHRLDLEARTDELAMAPWRHLGDDGCDTPARAGAAVQSGHRRVGYVRLR